MPYQGADSAELDEMLRRFGAELRRCRVHAGHSQASLAERSGVSQSTISRLERGQAPRAAVRILVQLSDAIGRRLPIAFCPHDHHCAWERLDANGVPIRKPVQLEQEWWFKGGD
jgi:transcriptional regulator with XRE-family HTH domain